MSPRGCRGQGDPDFRKFFANQFQRELEGIEIPGMPGASWDRKAAYLLWLERSRADDGADDEFEDML